MQLQRDVVFASLTKRAFRHANFALGDFDTGLCHGFGQIARTDGTEQLAFVTRLGDQRQLDFGELSGACFGLSLALGSLGFELGALRFERFDVVFGCRYGQAVGNQVITAVTGLDGDLVTQIAQLADVIEQNDFHSREPLVNHCVSDDRENPRRYLPTPTAVQSESWARWSTARHRSLPARTRSFPSNR